MTGYDQLIIEVPEHHRPTLPPIAFRLADQIVSPLHPLPNGYIDQQLSKLHAHHRTKAPYILFVDSDCMFHHQLNIQRDYFTPDGLPILLRESYSRFPRDADVQRWREITTAATLGRFDPRFEYMRRIPILFAASTLDILWQEFPHLIDHLAAIRNQRFSEFNLLGLTADQFDHDSYHWHTVTENHPAPPELCRQWRSWDGFSREVLHFIQSEILNS